MPGMPDHAMIWRDCSIFLSQPPHPFLSPRPTTTDWSSIIKDLNVKPVDPSKKSKVTVGEDENGKTTIEFTNAEITTSEKQEQKKQTTQDSTGTKEVDKGSKTTDDEQSGSGSNQINTRNSEVDASRWPTWIYFVVILAVIGGGVILYFKRATLLGKINKAIKWP